MRWDAMTEYRAGIVRESIEFELPDKRWFDIRLVLDCGQPPQKVRVKLTSLDCRQAAAARASWRQAVA
jgi:hypothetical protein